MSALRPTRENVVDAVTVIAPGPTRTREPPASQVTSPPQKQHDSRTERPPHPDAQNRNNTTVGASGEARGVETSPGVGREVQQPAAKPRGLKKRQVALGLLLAWGVYYFWPSHQQVPPPLPVPTPPVRPLTDLEVCDHAASSGDPVSFSRVRASNQLGRRVAVLLVNHGDRQVPCTADLAATERLIPAAERAEQQAPHASALKRNLRVTVEQFKTARLALIEPLPAPTPGPPAPPVAVQHPVRALGDQEICAGVSTSGDRVVFTGKVGNRPGGARFAVFHVWHDAREVTCAVDRIGMDELPKALAAVRSAPDGSELQGSLSHTVQELQKAEDALSSARPPPPEPSQLALQWTKGLVTGLSADGWPIMDGKVYPIYGVNPIPEAVGRTRFLDWLVTLHGRQLECREHENSGAYDCRVTPSNRAGAGSDARPVHVDVADTLVKNGATSRSVSATLN